MRPTWMQNTSSSLEVERYRKCKLNSHREQSEAKHEYRVSNKFEGNPMYKANNKYMQLKSGQKMNSLGVDNGGIKSERSQRTESYYGSGNEYLQRGEA